MYSVQAKVTRTMYNCQEMARKSRNNATYRVTLTPRTVVEGALALAEAEGLGAVTIRRLAKELGVTPMALYWHFRSKDELLDTRRRARLFLESLPPERYPRLVEAAAPLSEGVDPDAYFAFGLDLLLAGIEAMAVRKR